VSKPKNAPALFEMMRQDNPASDSTASAPVDSGHFGGTDGTIKNQHAHRSPMVRSQGDRVHFSLSTLSLAMAVFTLVLLLVVAFELGRRSGIRAGQGLEFDRLHGEASEELLQVRDQKPNPSVLEDLDLMETTVEAEQARAQHDELSALPGRQVGWNYIWIETFNTQEEALNAQSFIKNNSVESTIHHLVQSQRWGLFSTEGFNFKIPEDRDKCEQLQEKIKVIGQAYAKSGGRYRFHQCYPVLRKTDDTW